MKIPESIKVGGHTYRVLFRDDLWLEEGNVGQARHNTRQIIEIDPKLDPEQIGCTLWHEIIHTINRIYNNNQLGERDIDAVAEGLFQVLSDMGITFERLTTSFLQ